MDPNIQAATGAARVPPARAGLGLGDLVRITPAAADAAVAAYLTARATAAKVATVRDSPTPCASL